MSIIIVMRLADMHRVHPDQISGVCNRCGQSVGIYPSGQAAIKQAPDLEIVCSVCHPPGDAPVLAPGALFEPFESKPRGR